MIIAAEYTEVFCPWMDEQGENPYTMTRDGFCVNCGSTSHELVDARKFRTDVQAEYDAETREHHQSRS